MLTQCCKPRRTLLLFSLVLCSYASKSLAAEHDLAQKLIGKWEGIVLTGANQQRTLTIESVKRDGDALWADGRFGTEKGGKVNITVRLQ